MRIVLVEDHDSVAKGICYRMEDLGHSVDVISDGLAADQHLRMGGGDLVILDISLPGLDGLSILRAMRHIHISGPRLTCRSRPSPWRGGVTKVAARMMPRTRRGSSDASITANGPE